jgi:hypothetical protein
MKLDFRDEIQREILLRHVWDPRITEFILTNLSPGMLFIDIGANVGHFTLVAAQRVGPSGRVVAVQPNPSVAEQLRKKYCEKWALQRSSRGGCLLRCERTSLLLSGGRIWHRDYRGIFVLRAKCRNGHLR